ncbi:MAG: molybdopterin cofactor-binding domain-containing protein, partial [Pseudomonadota bacterium]
MITTADGFQTGDSPARLEDERFLTGKGVYVDDLACPEALYAVFLRSPHAHARIDRIDTSSSLATAGVRLVLTGDGLRRDGIAPLAPHATVNPHNAEPYRFEPQPILAVDRVRYVGEPVALVIGHSVAAAQDGVEAIAVDYTPLPVITTGTEALRPGSVQISDTVPNNLCLDWEYGDREWTDRAFATATYVVDIAIDNHRIVINPMEPRGAIAAFDRDTGHFRLDVSTQNVHAIRDLIADSLGVAPGHVRLVAPDVGGGFGVRNFVYNEYVALLCAARETHRPIKWINTRSDGFSADHQARDFQANARLALDDDGRFLGLAIDSVANVGGYMIGVACGVQTGQYVALPGSVYDIPAQSLAIRAALSNTAPIGVTRGPGFAEMCDVLERLIDRASVVTGIDRFALRAKNFIARNAMPWKNAAGTVVDSGDFARCFYIGWMETGRFLAYPLEAPDADGLQS